VLYVSTATIHTSTPARTGAFTTWVLKQDRLPACAGVNLHVRAPPCAQNDHHDRRPERVQAGRMGVPLRADRARRGRTTVPSTGPRR
jgi:hypothetical protein